MTAIVLDLDGVVYRGGRAITGAGEAITALMRDHAVYFATNNSRRSPTDTAEAIAAATGVVVDAGAIVTSAMAAAAVADSVPTGVVGGGGIRAALTERGIEVVDLGEAHQVVTGIDFAFTYDTLRDAASTIRDGARWIATNTDATFPAEDGLWPGAGALVAAIETASGTTPEIAGKPHPPMVQLLTTLAGETEVVVVGDRPETDIALARAGGWRAVLVLTGVTRDPASVPAHLAPDDVADSIADLPGLLG